MEKKLVEIIKGNSIKKEYKENNAKDLSVVLEVSRNVVAKHLNELFQVGDLIKINTRPIYFIDRKIFEEENNEILQQLLFESEIDLMNQVKKEQKRDFQKLIGHESSLKELVDKCKAAISYPPQGLPILFHGPTGSGKSYIAKLMYEYAKNTRIFASNAPFIHVNCSEYANNPELLTANLFGYKKGAFTGADQDNIGLIKAAENGVLFLDEIHCLKPECQEKLFIFMDSGNYRMLGNHEQLFHSKVYLAFATTENPENVLLKTLYRRIPIRLEVPSIDARGQSDKELLIIDALSQEQEKITSPIMISRGAYDTLLMATYTGNIGELKNVIQATCMKALYSRKRETILEIHTLDLPECILDNLRLNKNSFFLNRREMISLMDLKEKSNGLGQDDYLINEIKEQYLLLTANKIDLLKFSDQCFQLIETYYNNHLFSLNNTLSVKENYIFSSVKEIIEIIKNRYGIGLSSVEINILCFLIIHLARTNYVKEDPILSDFSNFVEKRYNKEYSIAVEISHLLDGLDINYSQPITAIIALIIVIYSSESYNNDQIGIIIAHGYATASSIANAVNNLLGRYIFDGIDMPLDVSTDVIIKKLNTYLEHRGNWRDLILLVDMGSLEDIYKGVNNHIASNIAIVNNVNTKLALAIGEGISKKKTLEEIFENVEKNQITTYSIIRNETKSKVILCACATGMGTAEKLKGILEDSLQDVLPIEVITYDYSTLLVHQINTDVFKNYEVMCIVGTLNPHIENIKFIPIEELILKNSFDLLTEHFTHEVTEEKMELFRKKLLKNFSLTNIIEHLTFLNPKLLLEKVSRSIDYLQVELHQEFKHNTCFGLYVHICCLIERLVSKEGIEDYVKTLEDCTNEEKEFASHVKKAFKEVEKYYKVSIPLEEIYYIQLHISSFQK